MEQKLVLPSLPVAIIKFLETSFDDSCDINTLADLAKTDPSLSASILRLANSPYFSKGHSVTSLKQAAIVLGIKLLRNIALTLSIYDAFSDLSSLSNFSLSAFWYHSLSTAASAKRMAEEINSKEAEEAFVAGLLHDIGQLALIREDPKGYQQIFQLACTGHTLIESEIEIWGRNHAEVGAELLKNWRLQPFVCDAVRYHHHPVSSIKSSLSLTRIIYLADILSHSVHSACSVDLNYLYQLGQDLLDIRPESLDGIRSKIEEDVETLSSVLGFQVEKFEEDERLEAVSIEKESRTILKKKARNHSLLVGELQGLLSATNEAELIDCFVHSLILILDVKAAFYLKHIGQTLIGVRAVGTRDDSVCKKVRLTLGNQTIWDSAFRDARPIFSGDFYSNKEVDLKIIEKQMISYMGGEFWAVPITVDSEPLAMAFITRSSAFPDKNIDVELLSILSRHVGNALKTYALKDQLRKEQTINDAILKHASTGFLLCKQNGEILFTNPMSRQLFMVSEYEIKGKLLWELLGLNGNMLEPIYREINSKGSYELIWNGEINKLKKWVKITIESIQVNSSKRLLVALHDITSEKLLEQEKRAYEIRLEEELEKKTNELKDAHEKMLRYERLNATIDFAKRVVHEVNNPLGVIKNYLKLLKLEHEKGKFDLENIDIIDRELDRITSILNQLRDFAKGEGQFTDQKEGQPGSLEKAIRDVERLMRPHLNEADIELKINIEPHLPLVRLDENGIKQVIINLIKNAKEALKGGAGKIEIVAYSDEESRSVILRVSDNGPGIDPNIRHKIFDPYISSKGSLNSGLGLSVCYGLIKSVGGEIDVEDDDNGTTFIIRLPTVKREEGM